jgi:hypothetical protein
MRVTVRSLLTSSWLFALPLSAQLKPPEAPKSDAAYIRMAETGGPLGVAKSATIMRFQPDGKASELRKGSNGFTCSILLDVAAMPFCADKNAWQFMVDVVAKQPKPTNNEPGIAYMAAGGAHLETAKGEVVMEPAAGTHKVREPPHWMLLWPIDPATSGLPTRPNASGVYIMFAGTPYAHLMVYQNPRLLGAKPAAMPAKKP